MFDWLKKKKEIQNTDDIISPEVKGLGKLIDNKSNKWKISEVSLGFRDTEFFVLESEKIKVSLIDNYLPCSSYGYLDYHFYWDIKPLLTRAENEYLYSKFSTRFPENKITKRKLETERELKEKSDIKNKLVELANN